MYNSAFIIPHSELLPDFPLPAELGYDHNVFKVIDIGKGLYVGINRCIVFIAAYRLNSAYQKTCGKDALT